MQPRTLSDGGSAVATADVPDTAPAPLPPPGRRGFALVFALLLLAALSAAAIAVLARARDVDEDAQHALSTARARHAAEGAVARARATLAAHREAGRPLPLTDITWSWTVAGLPVVVDVEPESAKVDVNTGAITLLPLVVDGAGAPPAVAGGIATAAERLRADGSVAASLATLLPPCARLGSAEADLSRRLTVATRARGLAPSAISDQRLAALPGIAAADLDLIRALAAAGRSPLDDNRLAHLAPLINDAAPLATLRARVGVPGTQAAEIELAALVQQEIGRPTARVIAAAMRPVVDGTACEG